MLFFRFLTWNGPNLANGMFNSWFNRAFWLDLPIVGLELVGRVPAVILPGPAPWPESKIETGPDTFSAAIGAEVRRFTWSCDPYGFGTLVRFGGKIDENMSIGCSGSLPVLWFVALVKCFVGCWQASASLPIASKFQECSGCATGPIQGPRSEIPDPPCDSSKGFMGIWSFSVRMFQGNGTGVSSHFHCGAGLKFQT